MDYIREAEKRLWHYRDLKRSLEWQEKEIARLKWEGAPRDIKAMNYDGMPKCRQQDDAYNTLFKLQMYIDMKQSTEEEIKKIDDILDGIDDNGCDGYKKILMLWYIEGWTKEEIAEELNYSSRKSIYTLRNEAIRKFSIRLFGLETLKAI